MSDEEKLVELQYWKRVLFPEMYIQPTDAIEEDVERFLRSL
jgi:hypothetical protein